MPPIPYFKLAIILAALAVIAGMNACSYSKGKATVQAEWELAKAAQAQELANIRAENRVKERGWADEMQKTQDALAAATFNTQFQLNAALADVQSDNLKLRERFRACNRVSPDTKASGGNHEASQGGLSGADQEFLLRIGAEADQVVHQLTSCQSYIRSLTP